MKILYNFLLAAFISAVIFAGPTKYGYRRSLEFNDSTWQRIALPDEIYSRLNQNLTDIRIFGFNNGNTVEAPYILDRDPDKNTSEKISFKLINKSHNEKGWYYTFDLGTAKVINRIDLNFSKNNFDWKADLQGSMDMKEWYTISSGSRIVSIKNEYTDYSFTTLRFENSTYKYFRVLIKTSETPGLSGAEISEIKTVPGDYRQISPTVSFSTNRNTKNTTINVTLKNAVPVSFIKLQFSDDFDYYRPVYIEYLSDSIKTEKGWKEYYKPLLNSYVTSVGDNEFRFDDIITSKIRIIILNKNNEPLNFGNAILKGKKFSLIARFTKQAEYYLYYGYKYAPAPDYDIKRFTSNIPANPGKAIAGEEEVLVAGVPRPEKSKLWLWLIIIAVIVTLGAFTVRMLRKEKQG